MNRHGQRGFTLLDVAITVALVGILAAVAVPRYRAYAARAKRAEAQGALRVLWAAERAYYNDVGHYTASFVDLGFRLEEGHLESESVYAGHRYVYQLSQPWGERSFYCTATANIDSDGFPDVLTIEEGRTP